MKGDTVYETDTKTYQDQKRECRECGEIYVWEAGEVRYFASRGLAPPSHCPTCRQKRKAALQRTDPIPVSDQRPDRFDPTGRWSDLYPTRYGGRQ